MRDPGFNPKGGGYSCETEIILLALSRYKTYIKKLPNSVSSGLLKGDTCSDDIATSKFTAKVFGSNHLDKAL